MNSIYSYIWCWSWGQLIFFQLYYCHNQDRDDDDDHQRWWQELFPDFSDIIDWEEMFTLMKFWVSPPKTRIFLSSFLTGWKMPPLCSQVRGIEGCWLVKYETILKHLRPIVTSLRGATRNIIFGSIVVTFNHFCTSLDALASLESII